MSTPLVPLSRIAGQPGVTEALTALVLSGEPVPPLLLHGPSGTGKRTTAVALAAALVCRHPNGADACGSCTPCRRITDAAVATELREGATSQDNPVILPDAGLISIPKGKTRISVLQARDLVLSLGSRPFELSRRVYIIDPADLLHASAANSLLKALEEPPPFSALVLVTSAPWSLPITVRSRLRAFRFRPLPQATIEEILRREGVGMLEAEARASRSFGSLTRARDTDPQQERERLELFVGLLEKLARSARPAGLAVAASEDLAADPATARTSLELLIEVLRDAAAAAHGAPTLRLDEAQSQRLGPLAPRLLGFDFQRVQLVERLRREIVIFNRQPRLAVEGALLALAGQLQAKDIP